MALAATLDKFRLIARIVALAIVLAICVFPAVARGQTGRGKLLLTVTDMTGAVLPGATVTVTGLDAATRAAAAPVASDAGGVATVQNLVPGRYSVEASFPAFDKGLLKEIRIRAGDNRQTIVLKLSGLTDSVTVGRDHQEAAADRSTAFGSAMTREQIDALSDDPDVLRRQLQDMGGPDAVIRVDSFEGGQLPQKSQIKSIQHSVRVLRQRDGRHEPAGGRQGTGPEPPVRRLHWGQSAKGEEFIFPVV